MSYDEFGFELRWELGDCDGCGGTNIFVLKHPTIWLCAKHWSLDTASKKEA